MWPSMGLLRRLCGRGAESAAPGATQSDLRPRPQARAELPHRGAFALEIRVWKVSVALLHPTSLPRHAQHAACKIRIICSLQKISGQTSFAYIFKLQSLLRCAHSLKRW